MNPSSLYLLRPSYYSSWITTIVCLSLLAAMGGCGGAETPTPAYSSPSPTAETPTPAFPTRTPGLEASPTPTGTPTEAPSGTPTPTASPAPPANQPPSLQVQSPSEGEVFQQAELAPFALRVDDDADPSATSVQVSSSLDGILFTGTPDASGGVYFAALLSVGTHYLNLRATDAGDLSVSKSLTVRVNAAPTAEILRPANDSLVGVGASLHVLAEVADEETDPQSLTAFITSSLDGLLASPEVDIVGYVEADVTGLSEGTHTLEVRVVDPDGAQGKAQVTVTVSSCVGTDLDGDGYGTGSGCSLKDCNDADASIHPGATEVCNGRDENCNAQVDDGALLTFYLDKDDDGYGSAASGTVEGCSAPSGTQATSTDCDDAQPSIHPGASEICNRLDDDCDLQVDEGVTTTFYQDSDQDGYGSSAVSMQACTAPAGYALSAGDCNDSSASTHPDASETCNGTDDNCDLQVDEGVLLTFYQDTDVDGYGSAASGTVQACSAPAGTQASSTDCDDTQASIHPGASELCNSKDDDCDLQVDEGVTTVFYQDSDQDGYGSPTVSTQACSAPAGYVSSGMDCDDSSPSVHPGAAEVCNGRDDDCDQSKDEGLATSTWFKDLDLDGFGAQSSGTVLACSLPAGASALGTDCDDTDATVYPGAMDAPGDRVDTDCDGGDGAQDSSRGRSQTTSQVQVEGENGAQNVSPDPGGDLDGDGFEDLLVLTETDLGSGVLTKVICGVSGPLQGQVSLADAFACFVEETPGDGATAKAEVGDVNGDGYDDILIGASGSDRGGVVDRGAAYLFYGPVSGTYSLSNANVILTGTLANDFAGFSVGAAGDVNRDGYADFLVGASGVDYANRSGSGMAYLILGSSSLAGVMPLDSVSIRFGGATAGSAAGCAVEGAGDVNGDSYADFLIGAYGYSTLRGAVYVIKGGPTFYSSYDLNASSTFLVRYSGTVDNTSMAGANLAGACDINQDGYDDFMVGCPTENGLAGNTYVIFGASTLSGTSSLSSAGAILAGESGTSYSGGSISCAGDINRDGFDDLVVGAYMYPNHTDYGRVYVLLGPVSGSRGLSTADGMITSNGRTAFGNGLTSALDLNEDGFADLAIGSSAMDLDGSIAPTRVWYGPLVPQYNLSANQPRFYNTSSNESGGTAVAGGADLNGDGLDELLIGAPYGGGAIAGGRAFLVQSVPGGLLPGGTALSTAARTVFVGTTAGDAAGASLTLLNDATGDGKGEVLVGAPGSDLTGTDGGVVYLISNPASGTVALSGATVRLQAEKSGDAAGTTLAPAGDLSGDGLADFLVGAPKYDNGTKTDAGAVYLVRGSSALAGAVSLGTVGYRMVGEAAGDLAGSAVASVGDFNGDGSGDFLIGAPGNDGTNKVDAGAAYLVFGPVNGAVSLASAGIRFRGATAGEQAGSAVAGAGDVNGDGLADLLIGAPKASPNGKSGAGAVYLILGTALRSGEVSLSTADATLAGDAASDGLGSSLAAGDVSGDGRGDLLLGAPVAGVGTILNAGSVYLITQAAGLSGTVSVLSVSHRRYGGIWTSGWAGRALAITGDTDGDGFRDLLIGVPGEDYGTSTYDSGATYLIRWGH